MIVRIVFATLCWVFVFFVVCVFFIVLAHTYCLFATTRYYDEDYVTTANGSSDAESTASCDDYRNILTNILRSVSSGRKKRNAATTSGIDSSTFKSEISRYHQRKRDGRNIETVTDLFARARRNRNNDTTAPFERFVRVLEYIRFAIFV